MSPNISWRCGESRVSYTVAAAPVASLHRLESYCLAQLWTIFIPFPQFGTDRMFRTTRYRVSQDFRREELVHAAVVCIVAQLRSDGWWPLSTCSDLWIAHRAFEPGPSIDALWTDRFLFEFRVLRRSASTTFDASHVFYGLGWKTHLGLDDPLGYFQRVFSFAAGLATVPFASMESRRTG